VITRAIEPDGLILPGPTDRPAEGLAPASAALMSTTSLTSKAIASSVALGRCAAMLPRVRPKMALRASGFHSGAPTPVSAGPNTT
jgi:hypothetical protein